MLRAKARERGAKGLFLGEGILDNPHMVTKFQSGVCIALVQRF